MGGEAFGRMSWFVRGFVRRFVCGFVHRCLSIQGDSQNRRAALAGIAQVAALVGADLQRQCLVLEETDALPYRIKAPRGFHQTAA